MHPVSDAVERRNCERQIGIFGLGRSGLAVARAALARGWTPIVFDQSTRGQIAKPEVLIEAEKDGIQVQMDWDGTVSAPLDLFVVNPAVRKDHPILRELIDKVELVSEVEFAYRISNAPILAITGTNGKSTTTVMLYRILREVGIDAVLCGNIFGSGYPEIPLTEAALHSNPEQVLIAEISSFQLEWVSQFRPVVAGITNITADHLDRYDSVADYAATKQRIFRAQTESDTAVVRSHDPIVIPPKRPQVLQFGATAQDARIEEDAIEFFGVRFETSKWLLRETHNLANASMAALMAYAYLEQIQHPTVVKAVQDRQTDFIAKRTVYSGRRELPSRAMPPVIIEVLAKFAGIRHRMEFLGERNGVRVINNSMCTNPDAVIKSVTSVRDSVHVLLGGVNKDLDFRPVKALLGNRRHQAYLFGRDAKQIQDQIGGLGETFDTMQEAFRAATEKAARGEVIMLAPGCASSDQFRDFRHRGDVFIELAKEWLHNEKEPTDT